MRLTRWNAWTVVPVAAGMVVAAAALTGTAAASAAGTQGAARGPVVKLVVAQNSITLSSFRGQVVLDPGVYVASLGSALQFDVRRASYTKPITLTQVIDLSLIHISEPTRRS